jgi:predicted acylesterase/phospholipase RssA
MKKTSGANHMQFKEYGRHKRIGNQFILVCLVTLIAFTAGCAKTRVYNPPPAHLEEQVQVEGFENVRVWGDKDSPVLDKIAIESVKREIEANGIESLKNPVAYLALSGGGENGAFGAGVLCGWTAAGNRPTFKLVTGISTGALLAPFAFLGSEYDAQLKEVYTTVTDKDIYTKESILTAYWRESIYDTKPLAETIAKFIDEKVLAAVAREYKKGRILLVGTTQLDAQRLVIWDMGAIASSGNPGALDLFRKVLLASASMPAIFPPVYIDVTAGGEKYEEMHVDGGTVTEMMLYEEAIKPMTAHVKAVKSFVQNKELLSALIHRQRSLYIIRNDQVKPEWDDVKPRLGNIAGRAISTLVKTHGEGDLYRIYVLALRDKIDYNLASIPKDVEADSGDGMFNQVFMQKLFNLAYEKARNGYPWEKYPPGYQSVSDTNNGPETGRLSLR